MLNLLRNTVSNFRVSQATEDANNFLAAAGITGQVQSQAIYNLVNDLQTSGLWSKMKAVYPMVTDNYNTRSYTEDFTNAFWSKYFSTITANSIVAPNGTLTGETLNEDNTTNPHSIYSDSSSLANTQYTSSIYVKAGTRRYVQLAATPNANDWAACIFDTTNPSFTKTQVSGNVTATFAFSAEANGWYRLSITWTCTVSGIASPLTVALIDVPTPTLGVYAGYSYTGNSSYVYVWGAQTQLGGLTQYQPIATTPSAFMASQMKYNLKDARDLDAAFRLTWSGGWTYSATGAKGNGTNNFATTYFNNASFNDYNSTSIYYYGNGGVNTGSWDIGNINSTPNTRITISPGTVQLAFQFNSANISTFTLSSLNGLVGMNRISSSQVNAFFNNTKIATVNEAVIANANANNFVIGSQFSNGFSNNSDRLFKFVSFGAGLSDQESLIYNQIIEKYQVALSRGVQASQSFYYNSAYSNETNTYLYSTQITGTTQVSAINTLINGLKANNLWTKMKAVYPFVTDYRNLLSYTEDFSNAYWFKTNTTITANSVTAPNGTLTADTLIDNATNNLHYISTSITSFGQNGNNTCSIYAKANTLNWVVLYIYDGTTPYSTYFNLSNGTVGTNPSGTTASIVDAGDGWYRCSITRNYNATAANANCGYMTANADGVNSYAGTGKSLYVWGAQFEIGTLSTYQPILGANNYATNVAAQMKFNLVNPQDTDAAFRLAFSGGWTYSTNGAQPNGTNGFADTFLIPNTSLSTSSSHLSFYSRTNTTSGTGYELARTHYALITQFSGNTFYANLETVGSYAASYTSTNGLGHFIASRINNTTTQGFKNGLKVINASQNSSLATSSLIISNNGGANYSNKQTAFVSIGDGFTDAEAALFYQLIQQFQTDLSRQV